MEEALLEIIAKLEAIAPHIWALAARQVWVDAVRDTIFGVLGTASVLRVRQWCRAKQGDGDNEIRWTVFALVVCTVGLAACISLYGVVGSVLNPQWQAIKLLRGLALGSP